MHKLIEQLDNITSSLGHISSEIGLVVLLVVLVIADLIITKDAFKKLTVLTGLGVLANIVLLLTQEAIEGDLFLNTISTTTQSTFYKVLVNVSVLLLILFRIFGKKEIGVTPSERGLKMSGEGEFYTLIIGMLIGLQSLIMSSNLLMTFLSIELISMPSYLLTIFRFDKKSAEASIKYLLFGALSTGVMLYGMSWLYGMSGSLSFADLAGVLDNPETTWMSGIGLVLTFCGFLFKLSAVPFHIWAPDVYQGAPTSVVAFFSVSPKISTMAVLILFLQKTGLLANELVLNAILLAGVVSIFWGNLSALWQKSAKRMLAYSTIAHVGVMLLGLVAYKGIGERGIMFYLVVYTFANYAAFFYTDMIEKYRNNDLIEQFAGLGLKNTLLPVLMIVVMVTLTGLPPTAGFTGKLFIFTALWEFYEQSQSVWAITALILGLVNTAIALFYYLKIPFIMYFRKDENKAVIEWTLGQKVYFVLLTLPLLVLFFVPSLIA